MSLEHRDIVGATCKGRTGIGCELYSNVFRVCHRDHAEKQLHNVSRKMKQRRENRK